MNNIILKLNNHKEWIKSYGKAGEKLNLDECDLRDLSYSEYEFKEGSITDCRFDEKELNNTDFYSSILCSSSFKNCSIQECDFYKADLSYTDLSYTDFSYANFNKTRFSKADISEADFRYCKLKESKLINTILYLTDFSCAELDSVDVSGASFDETIVKGIKFNNIIGLKEANIESINIGTYEEPELLYGDEAKAWLHQL